MKRVERKTGKHPFLRSTVALIGAVIGVGIFGLPYTFSQAGFWVGVIYLFGLGALLTVLLLGYGEVVTHTPGHARLAGFLKTYTNRFCSQFGTITLIGGIWGAMVAYIIIGGEFLHQSLSSVVQADVIVFQLIFFGFSALLALGGLKLLSRLEILLVGALIFIFVMIFIKGIPEVSYVNYSYLDWGKALLPYGVVLFAYGGLGMVPEMRDILGGKKKLLDESILLSFGIVALIYFLFAAIVIGVSGTGTSPEALASLGAALGPTVAFLAPILGLLAVLTSFLMLTIQVVDTLEFDYKVHFIFAWLVAVMVPLVVFLIGARDFIGVIGFTGAVLGGITGLIIVYMYERARQPILQSRKYKLMFPRPLMWLIGAIFVLGIISEIVYTLG